MAKNSSQGNIFRSLLYLFVSFIILSAFLNLWSAPQKVEEVSLAALAEKIQQDQVDSIAVEGEQVLQVRLKDQSQIRSYKETSTSLEEILSRYSVDQEKLQRLNIRVKVDTGWSYWLKSIIIPFLLPTLILVGIIWYMARQAQGINSRAMMFGQSSARQLKPEDKNKRTTFKDVAGAIEAKEELFEVVEFLRNPKKFHALGARIPKGVLLLGSPGCGKTLLARAVAGEANVPFFHISGSEFVEMFVGVGAARVRSLFQQAKRNAPSIIFVDEIDAVGRQRGAGLGGSHDEREQTLNQILVEMDGFEPNDQAIVMAATNRPDVLDPALLRPGRFDRRVVIDMPDIKDREAILKIHVRNKPLAKDVDLRRIAERTPGFSGADLANLLNEAAILAARRNKKETTQTECLESIEKVILGPERRSSIMNEKEKKITAYHEAGHALVAHETPGCEPVQKVSIISRGQAGGYTLKMPTEDKHLHFRHEFLSEIASMLGGYAAEKMIFHDMTTGASSDLSKATRLARDIVTRYGMSDKLGPRTFGSREELIFLGREISEQRDYSESMAKLIDEEVNRIISDAFKTAEKVLKEKNDLLEEIVRQLLEKETLEREAFEAIFSSSHTPPASEEQESSKTK